MSWHSVLAPSILVVAFLAWPLGAVAEDRPVPSRRAYELAAADRERMYAALRRHFETGREIPAFARKYGMKCSACHFAVPVLNRFGQAFKDNGFRMKVGTDDLRANQPAYWPVFAWLWKDYEVDVQRVGGETVQERGGVADGALVFGGMGSVSDRVSFRYLTTIYEDGLLFIDGGWIRYNQAFGTDWVNIRAGSNTLDLHTFNLPEYNMGNSRFAGMYFYSVPGTVSRFVMAAPNPGVEIMGHDRGSRTRYAVNLFNTGGAPRAHCAVCAPGAFGRATHRRDFDEGFLRSVQIGAFGGYATWPVGPDTSDLKGQQRIGGNVEFLLGSDVLPFRVTVMGVTGRDDAELVPTGTRDHRFDAGLLQLEYVPKLPLVFYGRLQVIRNQQQAIDGRPESFNDQDFQLLGVRHAVDLTSRFGWFLEATGWRRKIKGVGPGGADLTQHSLWLGTHLVF